MWIALYNAPGYLPETQPGEFEHFTEARDAMAEMLSRFGDEEHDMGNETRAEAFDDAVAEVLGWACASRDGNSVFACGYVFEIFENEDPKHAAGVGS